MNIYIYSDESGVLDKAHNDYFCFGGLVFLSKGEKDLWSRKYIAAERSVRMSESKTPADEIKATTIKNKDKSKLYRALNKVEKFGIVINQKRLFDSMFRSKKTKQRYLDWAYKMAIKNKLQQLINKGLIDPAAVKNVSFYVDEHTTATDGKYELKESLEQELKYGVYNWDYMTYYRPLFPELQRLTVEFCDSKANTLVRAADIVANQLYHMAITGDYLKAEGRNFDIKFHP